MSADKLNVAIVGLGFGVQFIPIYQRHPLANMYAICRRSRPALDAVGDAFGVERRYDRLEDLLADPEVDFVHINSPLTDHGWMAIAALKAGKHVMCTVPMAITTDECREIVEAVRSTGLKYMMAETVLYSREYFFVRELYRSGRLGKIQFLQGSHHQDMDGWPDGWPGLPPMYYATHCVAPCISLVGGEAEYVSCVGSGRIRDDLAARYGSPSNRRTSRCATPTSGCGYIAASSIRPGNTARVSTFSGRTCPSNGRSSRAKDSCFIRQKRHRRAWRNA